MFGLEPLPRSFEASLRDCESTKPQVRLSAVRDLGRHAGSDRSGRALASLRSLLADDPAPAVRGAAAIALADAEARSATEALLRAMNDKEDYVRQMALLALGELADPDEPRVVDVVRAALSDRVPALRFQGLIACHRLGLRDVEARLLDGATDPDSEVRHMAWMLVEERATDAEGTVRPFPGSVDGARRALSDATPEVRVAAAIFLARSGDDAGDAVIGAALGAKPSSLDPDDEQTAIVVAGERRLESARRGLERRAFGSLLGRHRFEYEARIALARLGDDRARRSIVRGLSAFTRDTRTFAVVAAGRARLVDTVPVLEAMRGDPRRAEPDAVEEALALLRSAGA